MSCGGRRHRGWSLKQYQPFKLTLHLYALRNQIKSKSNYVLDYSATYAVTSTSLQEVQT